MEGGPRAVFLFASMTLDWTKVRRVLVVKLRSIGDTVLSTPSLIALRRFLPDARIDVLLEDWVAPVLDGFDVVDSVMSVGRDVGERFRVGLELRRRSYDVAFNLHGGTTATWFARMSGAPHRIGYKSYQFSFFYSHLLTSAADFWQRAVTHSAEQQLALLGFVGVPVDDRPRSRLMVTDAGRTARIRNVCEGRDYALIHPTTAFFTKQWPVENFACAAEFLAEKGLRTVAISSRKEAATLRELVSAANVPLVTFDDLSLPEIIALASKARIFVGNDSGMAHIAAAVATPTVVIFGSSNRDHWCPWTDATNEIVYEEFACQPCPGYRCDVYGEPKCILGVNPDTVLSAIGRVLS